MPYIFVGNNTNRMDVRIVHTADNHIGKKYKGRYTAAAREHLVNERFEALKRVVEEGNRRKAHFLVIAGDLFDTINVGVRDIKQTVNILKSFEGEDVLVLPGNHDFYEQGGKNLWYTFTSLAGDAVTVLSECKPLQYNIGTQKVVFYPGPCTSKHSADNAIGWVKNEPIDPLALNIGIAHGNVEGKGLDNSHRYFNMTVAELKATGIDCWMLGHIHAPFPEKASLTHPGFFYPSTHTPDGFDYKREGYCWFIQFERDKKLKMEQIVTGDLRFLEWVKEINSADDTEKLCREIDSLKHMNSLLKLNLKGRISESDMKIINEKINIFQKMLLHLEVENNLSLQIDVDFINKVYPDKSLPHKLLMELVVDKEDNLALQMAHQMIEEAKV